MTREVRPWDIFNKNVERASYKISQQRLSICKECPMFISFTHQCKMCGCFMDVKTRLHEANCPMGKWDKINIPFDRELTEEEINQIGK